MKRTISLILSLLLVFSIVCPCFAVTDAEDRAINNGVSLKISSGGVATAEFQRRRRCLQNIGDGVF